ncbi:MAG: tRNA epoxyqueuosine(34) reductase QueG [Candidatus Contendobacter odensis]|uniref:Epoxyqueuosine reductase n=1 Tax=Candidatus Contendibacter odensensis TaxID=1400860 RepID=A0A2G6PGI2_9GAMM|nr:MAG: tRNA epoxyqueuosine(34) reductase QueG [Candidatus Contendobacter odensis]
MPSVLSPTELANLATTIKTWGHSLGFQHVGISDITLDEHEVYLLNWLTAGYHGEMDYMARHGTKRSRPAQLVPGTLRVITARMNYWLSNAADPWHVLKRPDLGYISRYALGRDYHKLLRQRLQKLAKQITNAIGAFGYRVFTDSAPVLEKALAQKAGLGWIGKHSNLLDRRVGSWFFLGEIYVNLPLPVDQPATAHCGQCNACLEICPTQAIIAAYRVDARRCISYHTIELRGSIPLQFRRAMGNRIYGCDDCQLVCPWNRFAQNTVEPDFRIRHRLDAPDLIALFHWDEMEFLRRTEGSAIRRIGHERWLRNIAVALGNAPNTPAVMDALRMRLTHPSENVREHVHWALAEQAEKKRPT